MEQCRVSQDELEHDRLYAEREKRAENERQDLRELTNIKRANIIEGNGCAVMEGLPDNMTPMQYRAIWNAWKEGDANKVWVIMSSLIEWEVREQAEFEAKEDLNEIPI